MLELPQYFLSTSYNAAHHPGVNSSLENGANCQQFAYELLRYYGVEVPNFRSSELWEDEVYSSRVESFQPLDLLLWNKTNNPWGAHVGVYLGENRAVHLAKKVGVPVIWRLEDFLRLPEYQVFIGAKRFGGSSLESH